MLTAGGRRDLRARCLGGPPPPRGDPGEVRQRDSYWLRNERMFEHLDAAVRERQPDRVLVITGAGHKYFLDELAREAGYRWVDPRDYLPPVQEG